MVLKKPEPRQGPSSPWNCTCGISGIRHCGCLRLRKGFTEIVSVMILASATCFPCLRSEASGVGFGEQTGHGQSSWFRAWGWGLSFRRAMWMHYGSLHADTVVRAADDV